jgi:hypothetical protein
VESLRDERRSLGTWEPAKQRVCRGWQCGWAGQHTALDHWHQEQVSDPQVTWTHWRLGGKEEHAERFWKVNRRDIEWPGREGGSPAHHHCGQQSKHGVVSFIYQKCSSREESGTSSLFPLASRFAPLLCVWDSHLGVHLKIHMLRVVPLCATRHSFPVSTQEEGLTVM